jgi:CobQ-like glutamine amidotransferase family enzyme
VKESTLDVALVFPEVLGTYGDRGNATALVHRARGRGIGCRVIEVGLHDPVPRTADIYLLGGGEDAAMLLAWERLRDQTALAEAVAAGAGCFAVCAGFQLLGHEFAGPDGVTHPGLGVVDVRSRRLPGPRAVGEVLADSTGLDIGSLTGFENHQGDADLGAGARPLARLVVGTGNGHDHDEGVVQGTVIGTYMHGPALVRNDRLADHLLATALGALEPFDDELVRRLRVERRKAALTPPRQRWPQPLRRRGRAGRAGRPS